MRTNFDFTPYRRSTVGFDRLFDLLETGTRGDGIATRPFERRFQLADFVEVRSADFENGLLSIELQRVVPEAMKPRRIEIRGGNTANNRIEAPNDEARETA